MRTILWQLNRDLLIKAHTAFQHVLAASQRVLNAFSPSRNTANINHAEESLASAKNIYYIVTIMIYGSQTLVGDGFMVNTLKILLKTIYLTFDLLFQLYRVYAVWDGSKWACLPVSSLFLASNGMSTVSN